MRPALCLTLPVASGVFQRRQRRRYRRWAAFAPIRHSSGVRLGPGDLLVIDNKRCAHARSSYAARFDGHDRWLQRAYVRRDIRMLTSESATSFRVLA
jgi:hypothetical protein